MSPFFADVIWRRTVDTRQHSREGGVECARAAALLRSTRRVRLRPEFTRLLFFVLPSTGQYCIPKASKTQFVFVTVALPYKLLRYQALQVHPGRDHFGQDFGHINGGWLLFEVSTNYLFSRPVLQ
jgi:hypothetical protein